MSSTVAVAGVMNSQLRDDRGAAWSSAPGTLRDANRGRHVDTREAAYLAELRCPEEHTAPPYPTQGGHRFRASRWWWTHGLPPSRGRSQDWALGVASQEVEVFDSEVAKDVVLFSVTKGQ